MTAHAYTATEVIGSGKFARLAGVPYETVRRRMHRGIYGPVVRVAGRRGRHLVIAEIKKRGLWPQKAAADQQPGQIVLPLDPDRKLRILRGAVAHAAPEARLDAAIAAFYVLAALLGPQEGEPLPDLSPLFNLGDELLQLDQFIDHFAAFDDPVCDDLHRLRKALHHRYAQLNEQLAMRLPRNRSGT